MLVSFHYFKKKKKGLAKGKTKLGFPWLWFLFFNQPLFPFEEMKSSFFMQFAEVTDNLSSWKLSSCETQRG